MNTINRRRFLAAGGAVGVVALAGCLGDDPADESEEEAPEPDDEPDDDEPEDDEPTEDLPDPTDTETALIEPTTLHEWQETGLVNKDDPGESHRVVILRIDDWYPDDSAIQSYEDGHVPGAAPWYVDELHTGREEGLGVAAPMVANGEMIDEALNRAGVCPRTTIVVSGTKPIRVARGYWTLRYWGFPRERVKVLNGGYHAYGEEYDLETGQFDPLDVPQTTFSVEANEELNNDLRVGIGQMIQRVDNVIEGESDDVILENRQDGDGDDATAPGTMISNAIWDNPLAVHEGDHHFDTFEAEGAYFKAADELQANYDDLGVSPDDTVLTYCGSGYRAAVSFFVLDGILEYDDVMLYDGSWGQWEQYAGDDVPEAWRVDEHGRTDGDLEAGDLEITVDETPDLDSPAANQVEAGDMDYMAGGDVDDDADGAGGADDFACSIGRPIPTP